MRRTFAAVALALLLALSGCSVLGGGQGSPTATAGQGLTEQHAPPGVSAEDATLTNSTTLLDAHTATLLETGFRYELRTNATVYRQNQTRQVGRQQVTRAAPGREQFAYTTVNPGSRFDVWGNKSVQAVKFQFGDQVQYRSGEAPPSKALTGQSVLDRYLSSGEWSVTNVTEREGTTLVTLASTTPPEQAGALPRNATDVRDYQAKVVVDSEGRVYQFVATGRYTIEGTEGQFRIVYTLQSIEDPGISRPTWLQKAFT